MGITEKGYPFEAAGLYISSYKSSTGATTLVCDGYIKVVDTFNDFNEHPETQADSGNRRVFAIELEGFKIQFSDHTEVERYRHDGKIDDLLNFKFDHTQCTLCVYDHPFHKYFNIKFSANEEDDNIRLEFFKTSVSVLLFEKDYKKFRDDLLHFLSLLKVPQSR